MRPEDKEDDYNEQEQEVNSTPSAEESASEAQDTTAHSDYKAPAKGDTRVTYHL